VIAVVLLMVGNVVKSSPIIECMSRGYQHLVLDHLLSPQCVEINLYDIITE
jgi:hypothetical protein